MEMCRVLRYGRRNIALVAIARPMARGGRRGVG